MNTFEGKQTERISEQTFVPPAIESFSNKGAAGVWPEEIANDPEFEQIKNQQELVRNLDSVFSNITDEHSLLERFKDGDISDAELDTLYHSLTTFMESDKAHGRMALYLPFELLEIRPEDASSPLLRTAIEQFQTSYKKAWEGQLTVHDVRANFVDGDVLETELRTGDLKRVVKAAHLIPDMVERGFISIAEVIDTAEHSPDPLLVQNMSDALRTLPRDYFSEADLETLSSSKQPALRSVPPAFDTNTAPELAEAEPPALTTILNNAKVKLENIENYEPDESTPARTAWLRKDAREKALTEASATLAEGLLKDTIDVETINDFNDGASLLVIVDAIRQASLENASVYAQFADWLAYEHAAHKSEALEDSFTKLYAHLCAKGIVSEEVLAERGIVIPKLEGPFSENLTSITPFLEEVETMTTQIEDDPYLTQYVYPTSLLFGSQLKGYGTKNADADVAVFIKPDTPRSEKAQIEMRLAEVFGHEKIGGKTVQFWLDETADGLAVHDFEKPAASDADSTWTHILFGASWHGNKEEIHTLQQTLLPSYFHEPDTLTEGQPTRKRWLEELERDTLQYRLMHKGYGRYYPRAEKDSNQKETIDGNSTFFDTGYRRLASRLFASRVFLPNIKKK
jgi:predicted nucleotidyltransferase